MRDFPLDDPVQRPTFYIKQFAVPGGTVASVQRGKVWDKLIQFRPDLIFLVIGGNDISLSTDVTVLAKEIENLAKRIEECTGGYCKIVGLEHRTHPHDMNADEYTKAKNAVNLRLRRQLYWARQRYMGMGMYREDLWDGVHLGTGACQRVLDYFLDVARSYFEKKDEREDAQ